MRIATWNVNSIRTRKALVVDFLHQLDVDVVAMQETKCRDDQFPFDEFDAAGYEVAHFGLNQWNGVAIASRLGLSNIEQGFPGMPGFSKTGELPPPLEARAISATIEGVRICSVYVPNGRGLDDPHFSYKLSWLDHLGQAFRDYAQSPHALPFAIAGDFNVAPVDSDVGDTAFLQPGTTHTSEAERKTLAQFETTAGVADVVRPLQPEGYTFWDYKQGKFAKDEGLRIDFIYGSPSFVELVEGGFIHRDARKGESPSDHVPVIVDLASEDEDDRPMIF
tara:strand:- start:306 stop:1139 length:834 start_codon:yes stop_codon:yes gene_type:complete